MASNLDAGDIIDKILEALEAQTAEAAVQKQRADRLDTTANSLRNAVEKQCRNTAQESAKAEGLQRKADALMIAFNDWDKTPAVGITDAHGAIHQVKSMSDELRRAIQAFDEIPF